MENLTPTKLALISRRAREDIKFLWVCYQSLGKENAGGIKGKSFYYCCRGRLAEEPDEGNLQVRFCEGRKALLQG